MSVPRSELLLDLSFDITSSLDVQEVLDRSLAALRRLVEFDGGSIQLVEDGLLRLAATDPPATEEAKRVRIPVGQGVGGRVVAEGRSAYIPDILSDSRVHRQGRAKATSPGVRSWFGVPLVFQGRATGLVQVDSARPDAFDESQRDLVHAFVPTIAVAVQNALLFAREAESVERLREAERLKANFLSMVSHELRTPITSIFGFADVLASREGVDPLLVVEFGRRIALAARRLEAAVEDLLDVSGIEQGSMLLRLAPTDVGAIVRDAVQTRPWSHAVKVEVAEDCRRAQADEQRLRQVVLNLVANATKFSEPGTPILVDVRNRGNEVEISVRDGGRGIDDGDLDRVFDRFYQCEPTDTRTVGGLGIGLYLVRKLCDRMGGRVSAHSAGPGTGSTFVVGLRAHTQESAGGASKPLAWLDTASSPSAS